MSAWNDKELWQSHILECLAELSDLGYQGRTWRGEIPGEIHSFEEFTEMLFGDTNLSDDPAAGEVFSAPIDHQLRNLGAVLSAVNHVRPID